MEAGRGRRAIDCGSGERGPMWNREAAEKGRKRKRGGWSGEEKVPGQKKQKVLVSRTPFQAGTLHEKKEKSRSRSSSNPFDQAKEVCPAPWKGGTSASPTRPPLDSTRSPPLGALRPFLGRRVDPRSGLLRGGGPPFPTPHMKAPLCVARLPLLMPAKLAVSPGRSLMDHSRGDSALFLRPLSKCPMIL